MDRAWLDGNVSAEHLRHTRPTYYAELLAREQQLAAETETPDADVPSPDELDADVMEEPVGNEFSER
jgi:hypothetical protein